MAASPIRKELYIEAPPELVFTFLTDPAKMARWLGTRVELEPRPGGLFRMDPNRADVVVGNFLEVVPPSRVVFTWGWEGADREIPAGSTVVEIELEPEGDGTRLRLTHRDLPEGDLWNKHDQGWTHYLGRLRTVAEGGDPGPDPCADPTVRHG
jgi:uncharacterized protein YndB with AHSA1/START domain